MASPIDLVTDLDLANELAIAPGDLVAGLSSRIITGVSQMIQVNLRQPIVQQPVTVVLQLSKRCDCCEPVVTKVLPWYRVPVVLTSLVQKGTWAEPGDMVIAPADYRLVDRSPSWVLDVNPDTAGLDTCRTFVLGANVGYAGGSVPQEIVQAALELSAEAYLRTFQPNGGRGRLGIAAQHEEGGGGGTVTLDGTISGGQITGAVGPSAVIGIVGPDPIAGGQQAKQVFENVQLPDLDVSLSGTLPGSRLYHVLSDVWQRVLPSLALYRVPPSY